METNKGSAMVAESTQIYDRPDSPESGFMQQDLGAMAKKTPPLATSTPGNDRKEGAASLPCSTAIVLQGAGNVAPRPKPSDILHGGEGGAIPAARLVTASLPSDSVPANAAVGLPVKKEADEKGSAEVKESNRSHACSFRKSSMDLTFTETDLMHAVSAIGFRKSSMDLMNINNDDMPMCDLPVPASVAAKAVFEAFRGSFRSWAVKKETKRSRTKLPRRSLVARIGEREVKVKLLCRHIKQRKRKKHPKTEKHSKEKAIKRRKGKDHQQKQPKQTNEMKEEEIDGETDPALMTERQQIAYLMKIGEIKGELPVPAVKTQTLPKHAKSAEKTVEKAEETAVETAVAKPNLQPATIPMSKSKLPKVPKKPKKQLKTKIKPLQAAMPNTTSPQKVAKFSDAGGTPVVAVPPPTTPAPPGTGFVTETSQQKIKTNKPNDAGMEATAIDFFCESLQVAGVEEVEYDVYGCDSEDGLIAEYVAEESEFDNFDADDADNVHEEESAEPFPHMMCTTTALACF
jgi:hypothetical protein